MSLTWATLLTLNYALAIFCVLRVLARRPDPTVMVAWIFGLLFVPGLGVLAYYLMGSNRLKRKARRRRRRVAHLIFEYRTRAARQARPEPVAALPDGPPRGVGGSAQKPDASPQHLDGPPREPGGPPREAADLADDLTTVARLAQRLADMPVTGGNTVSICEDGPSTFAAFAEALEQAQHHIHLLFYIWKPDRTGYEYRDRVITRARAGIECRMLLDAVGCYRLGRRFLRPLQAAGVKVAFFLPLRALLLRKRWSLHLRNHRKIVIIDGRTGFVGSHNVGDEYRGQRPGKDPWYDVQLRVDGPAALFLQQAFAEDWYLATREQLNALVYFPDPPRAGQSAVQILPTGPDQSENVLTQVMFAAVSTARSSIRIATPYFVPDVAIRLALMHACYRGVKVRLVLPSKSDSAFVLWAARSFYPELLEAGVEICEYDGGVLHSKVVTVDDRWCMIGSANMDARSFQLNFELTAVVYDKGVAGRLSRYVDRFCAGGRRITPHAVWRTPTLRWLGEGVARLFAPLL